MTKKLVNVVTNDDDDVVVEYGLCRRRGIKLSGCGVGMVRLLREVVEKKHFISRGVRTGWVVLCLLASLLASFLVARLYQDNPPKKDRAQLLVGFLW